MINIEKINKTIIASLIILVGNTTLAMASTDNIDRVVHKAYENLNRYQKIRLSEYSIQEMEERKHKENNKVTIYGEINSHNKTIGIVDTNNEVKMTRVLYHEIGHMIDTNTETNAIGLYSNTEEFKGLYERNKEILAEYSNEHYFETSKSEFFAESFGMYLEDREKMRDRSKEVYEYFKNIEEKSMEESNGIFITTKDNSTYCIVDGKPVSGWVTNKNNGLRYYFNPIDNKMMYSTEVDGVILTPSGNEYKSNWVRYKNKKIKFWEVAYIVIKNDYTVIKHRVKISIIYYNNKLIKWRSHLYNQF